MAKTISLEAFLASCTRIYSDAEWDEWFNKEKGVVLVINKGDEGDERFILETCDDDGRRHQTSLAQISSGATWEDLVAKALGKDNYAASRMFLDELLLPGTVQE